MTDSTPLNPIENADVLKLIRMFEDSDAPVALLSPELRIFWTNRAAVRLSSNLTLPDGLAQLLNGDLGRYTPEQMGGLRPFTMLSASSQLAIHLTPLTETAGYLASFAPHTEQGATQRQQAMATALSGQLRRPLHHMFASIAWLRQLMLSEEHPELEEFVESINQNAYKLLRTTHNLTEYLKLLTLTAEPEIHLNRVELGDLLDSLLRAAAVVTGGAGIPLSWQPHEAPLFITADEQHLVAALMQIISNSCRFTREGNAIEVSLTRRGGNAVITFTDHGPGIPELAVGQVFEPFFSYDHTGLPYAGMGLGLTIARAGIMQLGGRIALSSREDEGTTVVVTLPLAGDDQLVLRAPQPSVDYLRDRFSLLHVLLSDSCGCPAP